MIEIPKKYEVGKKISIKDFIPSTLSLDTRKKVKEIVSKVVLTYQISGEEIPSVRNEMYECRLIQFYDFEVNDIKKAGYISKIYQGLIKSPCIIRIFDKSKEIYSFGLKRLNQNDRNEIVLEESFISDSCSKVLPSLEKKSLEKVISFENVINKTNKVNFYLEIYAKAFILKNQKLYMKSKELLEKPVWYDEKNMRETYELFRDMVKLREKIDKLTLASEKVKYNQELKEIMEKLEKI
ncbi:DUF4391 domain-containing protein [Fusobacterium mortiferum]|uniref:DUF4391 domain-containing protein n=1 Tax=Fusobacterium mortiferum TaxID=850 RepID=UPI0022E5D43C|nr:DUF4391 domain-containing protein [Fusobacterium mortiferum]